MIHHRKVLVCQPPGDASRVLVTTSPARRDRMTTEAWSSDVFCRVDTDMHDGPNQAQANLYPSEVVPVARLFGGAIALEQEASLRPCVRATVTLCAD